MTTTARTGRRRRILHDGAASPTVDAAEPATRARYTPREGSASFAVATAVAPRSSLAIGCLVGGMAAVTAALVWADGVGLALESSGTAAAAKRLLLIDTPGSLASWWESVLWVAVAAQAFLLFGLRRHRTDDTRGAYRWWLVVAAVAGLASLGASTTAPAVLASQVAAATGFSPLAEDAFWWLAPGLLALAAIGVRSLLEVRESGAAAAAGVGACGTLAVGWSAGAGVLPTAVVGGSPVIASVCAMAGAGLSLVALLLYSQRIVRETLGELRPPRAEAEEQTSQSEETTESANVGAPVAPMNPPKPQRATVRRARATTPETESEPVAISTVTSTEEPELFEEDDDTLTFERRGKRRASQGPQASRWTNGTDSDEEGPSRRRQSKAERKQLRREKERRAA